MNKLNIPITNGIRQLRNYKIEFIPHFYKYEEHGGTKVAANAIKVPEHNIIKTIVMKTDTNRCIIVLMHGDYEVSTKNLARILGVKHIETCDAKTAEKLTGYIFGGMSPFGIRKELPVFVEKTIFDLDRIYVNAGKRGFLIEISPKDLERVLKLQKVEAAIKNIR